MNPAVIPSADVADDIEAISAFAKVDVIANLLERELSLRWFWYQNRMPGHTSDLRQHAGDAQTTVYAWEAEGISRVDCIALTFGNINGWNR